MGHVHSSHLDTSGIAKANCDTGFVEIFALVSLFFLLKAALLSGGDNFHVEKKKGRGIHKSGEIKKWATIIGKNDLRFTNKDYEAEPVIGPSDVNVQQCNGHVVGAEKAFQFSDGCLKSQEEYSGQKGIGENTNIITRTFRPDPPTAEEPRVVLEQVDLSRRPDPPVGVDNYPKFTDYFRHVLPHRRRKRNY